MKNFLFSLFLLCSSFFSFAQLRINELYVKPVNGDENKEFIELAQDPNLTSSENSDGYALLSYFDNGTQKGFYVLDMPYRDVAPGAFLFVAAGPKGSKYQDTKTFTSTPHYNWNVVGSQASAKKFVLTNGVWNSGTSIQGQNVNDLFSKTPLVDGFSDMVVLLYRKQGTTMELVDGFIASEAEDRFEVPQYIETLPALTFKLVSDFTSQMVKVDFSSIGSYELGAVPAAAFTSDDGYYFCGSWDQPMSGQYLTPNFTNTSLQGNPLQALTNCLPTNNKVTFTEVSGQVSAYPVVASLYIDKNTDQKLDLGDVKYSQIVMKTQGKTYSMAKPVGNNFILVLDGAGQCFDDVIPFFCDPAIVTPVTFTSFNALRKGSNVDLSWQTASESNNKGFYVERRKSASDDWETLTFVESKAPGGTSSSALSYSFSDANAASGITQYRLLQIDYDGKHKYSTVLSVRGPEQAGNVSIYPNPTSSGTVNIVFDQASTRRNVIVTDMVGRVLQQYKGISSSSLQIGNLKAGLYNIMIQNTQSGTQTVERVTVTR
jgi:hypothetical protein